MSLHLQRCACWIMCNCCFQAHADVLICSQPPQSVIAVHLQGRIQDLLLKMGPAGRVWGERIKISHQTKPPPGGALLCECAAAVEQSACCRLGPPLPSGPRSVLTGPGRLHGAAVEMSRSPATGLRQGTLVLPTQDQMRCLTC